MTTMTTDALRMPRSRALTRADLATVPDDGHRYELIDGILVVSPAPRPLHQLAVAAVSDALRAACPPGIVALSAPLDVVLADDTVIQPDLLVTRSEAFAEANLPTAPLLAVEVLSPSTRGVDLLLKKERLQRAGCPNYWVVDPDEPSVTAWALRDGDYELVGHAVGDEEIVLLEPIEVALTPVELVAWP